ncbi:SRPBCC family protein [Sandaracinus amylolyticus]|uniref:SRPBCC family protein n=1 Tax=Sandaracinus amylolyticus TaxID=927083 RepID=UPI001F2D7431|nr:SRPBCC family protein [Sandaracinus amylolyticus]UJR86458.1 Hypothetical protein I5071_85530 [Sandaracinus amylolyticus]
MGVLFDRHAPLPRGPFLVAGVVLFAIKIGLDALVSRLFGQPYSVLFYVSPMEAPLFSPGGRLTYWLAMWAVALPFIAVGVWLTARRLVDAGLPSWLVGLFFAPFANLIFFLAIAAVPSKPLAPRPTGYREPPPGAPPRSPGVAVAIGGVVGAVVALAMVGISVGLFREYGAALFLGAPTISGFVATLTVARLHAPRAGLAILAAGIALGLSFAAMLAFAIEGFVCLMMASPLAVFGSLVGVAIGSVIVSFAGAPREAPGAAMALLPLWLAGELLSPLPPESERVVTSTIEIDAPPEVVWNRVLAFEDLPPPTELLFRLGVASPTGAVIEGEGVGAVRRCQFTTGEFVEPITVWRPGRELSFDVREQPDAMREMTPFDGPRPPHLDGFFATTRGQFVLEPIEGGRTRLSGRTWYRLEVFPRPYWAWWSDQLIHTIHLRVMNQIARLSESDARR